MAEQSNVIQKVKSELPGKFVVSDTGEQFYVLDRREDNLYDTHVWGSRLVGTALAAGARVQWFQGVAAKSRAFTNFVQAQQVPPGWYIAVNKLGIVPKLVFGNTVAAQNDVLRVLDNASASFTKIETVKKEGPPIFWQSGIGYSGATQVNNAFNLSMGVPSPAAVPDVAVPFSLKEKDSVQGWMEMANNVLPDAAGNAYQYPTLASACAFMIVLHGIIMKSGVKD